MLWPRPSDESPPLDLAAITREVEAFARGPLAPWEAGYLEFHRRRYQDTLRLLPEGHGRRLLDVGSFPGHLSALAHARGWEVAGLNTDIENASAWVGFLERCREHKIDILSCDVEREPFPADAASFEAVLFCELFEHLYWNPFHTLKEIFRVLKPGGLLILTTPNVRRAETLFRYFHGWGSPPPVSRPFHALFPSLLYHRHNREYTAKELDYYLARQGKDLYDFREDAVYHADCLDADHEIPAVRGERAGPLEQALARLLRRVVPGTRGQLMARAWRSDAALVEWATLRAVEGFGPLEEDEQPIQGFTRRLTFPIRRTGPRAAFEVPLPSGTGPVLLALMVAHLAPEDAPPAWTRWTLDGHPAMSLELRPALRPVRVRLLVPASLAARGAVRVALETSTWREPTSGREIGLSVGGQWVLTERLGDTGAVEAAIERTAAERRAEESPDGWWHAAASLYIPHRVTAPALEMGPGDDAQLGPGWYHREDWGRLGAVRWAGPEAIVYLATDGQATAVRVRAYAGEPRLGPVQGWLDVAHAAPDGAFRSVGTASFALAADAWAELEASVPRVPGRLRITVRVESPRIPRALMSGSQDARPLGLAVRRVWLI
ncbi:MAG: methyltransferase domain-containing protein [Candidatus Rokuibacteriota bacterium]